MAVLIRWLRWRGRTKVSEEIATTYTSCAASVASKNSASKLSSIYSSPSSSIDLIGLSGLMS